MRIVKPSWHGIDHNFVATKFEGNPQFVNEFCVNGEYSPSAIYYCAKPNKRKKHKTYVILTKVDGQFVVRGMSPKQMQKYRYQGAAHCLSCDEVVYSVMRHDCRPCSCGAIAVDGGQDYFKMSFQTGANFKTVRLDLLTDTVSETK